MYHNEGGGEEFSRDISLVDRNIFGVNDIKDTAIIGNIHDK